MKVEDGSRPGYNWRQMGRWFRCWGGVGAVLSLLGCSAAAPSGLAPEANVAIEAKTPVRDVPPGPVSLDAAGAAAEKLPRLRSLLVHHRGELILEQYFNGAKARRPANIKSASKTVISALVGIAIGRGLIDGVDAPIGTFFTKMLAAEKDAAKRVITIGDLLTMRSGLESTSGRNYGAWVHSSQCRRAFRYPDRRVTAFRPSSMSDPA